MLKDAFWFPHDANARNDPDILDMRSKYKCEGYGWFWVLIEMMREQCDYKLMHCKASAYAMQCQCQPTKIIQFISDCVACGLFESDGECFWSSSLIRRMEGKDRRAEAGREAANKRWAKVKECEANANPLPTQSEPNAKRKEEKRREEKTEEPKLDCSNEQSTREAIINGYTQDEDVRTAIREFIKMRTKIKKPLTDYALKLRLKDLDKLATSDGMKIAVLNQSTTAGWQDLYALKTATPTPQTNSAAQGMRRMGTRELD